MRSFLLFLFFLLIGLSLVLMYNYWNTKFFTVNTSPGVTTKFSLKDAPSESLSASVATLSGSVNWRSRISTNTIQLKMYQKVQQGEEITTGHNGKAGLKIQNDAFLLLEPNTHIAIIQLLPVNFVFVQDKGKVEYANTIRVPISVRSLDLLSVITNGDVIITVDPNKQTVMVAVLKGSVKEGYEDLQNTNTVMNLNAGQIFVFDETNRIGTIR
jgi:hypothetical protein